jgi:DNA-binding XRE family transcriptional regulator
MKRSFKDLRRETMSEERIAKNKEKALEILEKMPLYEIRKALKLTQQQIASELEVSQAAVSKMERQPDMYIKTLDRFVRAMGGRLLVRAVFPQGEVEISEPEAIGTEDTFISSHRRAGKKMVGQARK